MVERSKIEAMATKCRRIKKEISLSTEEKKNYENNIRDETDPNYASNDKNLFQL